MLIKDILTINLTEDIKNVIDLEDISEAEILLEINNYIITDGLAREYADFVSTYCSNILETGVWISGFYGSGKSYFGKLLGYLLSNPVISGTPARERILNRFTGIDDEPLVKNTLAKLNAQNSRVVFLDVAKQDTSKGLAYTFFRNFLKSLELPENEYGYCFFELMVKEKQLNIHDYIFEHLKKEWKEIKPLRIEYSKALKSIFLQEGGSESDYDHYLTSIRNDLNQFSAATLKDNLTQYLQIERSEKIIFLFDEASEAIEQKKFTLLDLEGISESLSALGGKVWTIAIAQEKLDEIINNSNISRAQLTKVTDRFKTKIHLEATEVDVIIRNRLLKKKDDVVQQLKNHYSKNSGKIADYATLNATGLTKTETQDSYTTYYPFFKYQFDLLQNFLFGTKGYASTKVAARGMIITTYDILRNQLQDNKLFDVATGWQIAKEAQPQPHVRLVNRYDNAEKILKETGSTISGRRLLETIHFLSEAEVVPTTIQNIIKTFIKDPDDFHKVQGDISKALEDLVEAKILLPTNGTFRITSDIEQRLLDEMNNFMVQGYTKKKQAVTAYKASTFVKSLSRVSESNIPYDFYITTDNDDELTTPMLKYLKVRLKSVYSISDDRTSDIDALKVQHQNDKDLIWIVPDNASFQEIDKLVTDIEKIGYLEDKYTNPQSDEGQIIRSFSTAKSEKESRLKDLIEFSLQKGTAIYLFNTYQLDKDNWLATMQGQERLLIQNVYDKRLGSQLSDSIATSVIKEANNNQLQKYFHGNDFQFFDATGNFVGDNLKVVEEITFRIRNNFVDGKTLEKELEQPPTGFQFGTVISTTAALMRAGKIIAKHNGVEKYSWRDDGVNQIFDAALRFRNASFKAVARSLTATQKNDLVKALQDMRCQDFISRKVDWNTNDFDLVTAVRELARRFCDKVDDMRKQNQEFDALFPDIENQKTFLSSFTGAVSEANYIDKAETFLAGKAEYEDAIDAIEKVEKFIRTNLPKLKQWMAFNIGVTDELKKAGRANYIISQLIASFNTLSIDVVKNFSALQQTVQKVKDEYYKLMAAAGADMALKYENLKEEAELLLKEIDSLPSGLNDDSRLKAVGIMDYASQRTQSAVDIDFSVQDKTTKFTYSEMLSYYELCPGKMTELGIIKAGLKRVIPPEGPPTPPTVKTYNSHVPSRKMKISAYKSWLQQELQKLSSASDNDEVEID